MVMSSNLIFWKMASDLASRDLGSVSERVFGFSSVRQVRRDAVQRGGRLRREPRRQRTRGAQAQRRGPLLPRHGALRSYLRCIIKLLCI